MKMNKKGFTLIEMLVVIAIIAVLVAIVIPTVTSATGKAAAATNAANLRSVKAAVTTAYLSGELKLDDIKAESEITDKYTGSKPASKKVDSVDADTPMTIKFNPTGEVFTVTYGDQTINDFAYYAENAAWPGSST